jgi:hypothetical protein
MGHTILCLVTTSANILSTLRPTQQTHLEWVRLTTECVYEWICKRFRFDLMPAWRNFNTILSELANVAIGWQKRLTLVLTSVCDGVCVPLGREWLCELLPLFYELGELYVECKPDGNRSCFRDGDPIVQDELIYLRTTFCVGS